MSERDWSLNSGERQVAPTLGGIREDHVARYEWALDRIARPAGQNRRGHVGKANVLDACCGIGYGAWHMAELGCDVLGFDGSAEAIAYGVEHYRHPRLRLMVSRWPSLGIDPAAEFDAVVAFEAVEHVGPRLVRDLWPFVMPGGLLLLSTPNAIEWPLSQPSGFHLRHWSMPELAAIIGEGCPDYTALLIVPQERERRFMLAEVQK